MLIEALAAMAVFSGASAVAPQDISPRVAPRGDYRQSCSGEYVNRGRLYADCRNREGRLRATSIELNRCTDFEIRNDNGLLVCGPNRGDREDRPGEGNGNGDGGWDNGGGWGGGRRQSITVYRDAGFQGASTQFEGEVTNLAHAGFNDVISSMQFRGQWEACTDSFFRGQCQTFSDDVRNLSRWGMNDKISSLRPLRNRDGRNWDGRNRDGRDRDRW